MAFLRSSKFIRYFSSFARIFKDSPDATLLQQSQSLCGSTAHGFATAAAHSNQLDRSLKRLDQDVRRSGRISRRDIEEILDEIKTNNTATSSQSLMVIRCCGNLVPEEVPETRTALVNEIWKTLNALKVPMDISHYNALLRVYLENEHPFKPTQFLAMLEEKGIEPNRVTYQRLISRYCQDGDIEGATQILEFMKEKQLPVNENVFNALIMGHSQADDMESARGILAVMKQTGLEPSADTYTTLLCGYARKGDIDTINGLLAECEKNEVYLIDKDLLDIVYALCTNGFANLIDPILGRITRSAGYNQDAVNTILRLINKGHEDVAMKILKTMPRGTKADGQLVETGNFYIRHLVKAQRPAERILAICKELETANLNNRALLIAVEAALSNGLVALATPLLKAAHANGLPIRQHYFWPLICSAAERGQNEVIDVLQTMQTEFNISASGETIRDYVIPNLKEKNYEKVVNLLRTGGATISTAHSNVVYHAVCENDLKKAAEIAGQRRAFYNSTLFRRPLLNALNKTKDVDSYVQIVRQIYDNLPRLEVIEAGKAEEVEEQQEQEIETVTGLTAQEKQKECLGLFIYDACVYFRTNRVEMLEAILQGFVNQGLSISNRQAGRIQERLEGADLTDKISNMLGKLAAGDLAPVALERSGEGGRSRGSDITDMDLAQIERLISNLEAKGENVKSLKRQLLIAAIKKKDLEKVKEIIQRLESENYVITPGAYAQLVDLYCAQEKLDEALAVVEKIRLKDPEFMLDDPKKIHIIQLMCQQDKYEDAVKFLEAATPKVPGGEEADNEVTSKDRRNFNYNSTCWRLLNSIAEKGKVTELKLIFDALLKSNSVDISNVLLGPLIKVHLVNDDLKAAVDAFESICQKYRATPWKNELACRLIQAEDANNLQRLTDLSTDIHGEVNSLYDLVFSFVECGRIRQARKILETPGLRTRPQRINSACDRYLQEGSTKSLEGLMEATKDLSHIDRADIYQNLLLSYIKEKDPEKALGLWTRMQDEELRVMPSDSFLRTLGEFLKSNNCEVPFIIPELPGQTKAGSDKVKVAKKSANAEPKPSKPMKSEIPKAAITAAAAPLSEPMQQMKKAIRSRDADQILMAHKQLPADQKLNLTDQSIVVESLIKSDRLDEATKQVGAMLENKSFPIPRIFRFYLNKLAQAGDVATLERFEKLLDPEIKKVVSFDNRLCHANISAGKSEQYLEQLEKDLAAATDADKLKVVAEKFPRGGAAGILEQLPAMCDRFEKLAEKYAEKGILAPMNILWAHQFIAKNETDANRIWDKYLNEAPRLMFQRIVQQAREQQDETLVVRLLELLKKSTKVSEGAIGNAYSCLLDIQTNKQEFDRALETLNLAIKDVCLENFNRTALLRIKEGLEKAGKQFPHKIPERTVATGGNQHNDTTSSSSSSSSSSDEDRAPKQKTPATPNK